MKFNKDVSEIEKAAKTQSASFLSFKKQILCFDVVALHLSFTIDVMKILYSVQSIRLPLSGVGRYALNLAQGLAERDDLQVEFLAGGERVALPRLDAAAPSMAGSLRRWLPFQPWARRVFHALSSARVAAALRPLQGRYVCHEPSYLLPPYQGPAIASIHDLSFIHYPQYHPADRIDHFKRNLPDTLARASHIITGSDFTRQEIIDQLGVAPERVTRVYHGVDARYAPRSSEDLLPVLTRYGLLGKSYLLVVGTLEPRKNLRTLIEAYCQLPARWQQQFPLVLVGARGWIDNVFMQRLERLQAAGVVIWPGYVSEQDLPLLYAGAHGFAFPSLYEGFGLPALEAMASGVPLLVSACSSLPEVVGRAALCVDTLSEGSLREALQRLMEDEAWRQPAREAGLLQAAWFTWPRCVVETIKVYRQVWQESGLG